MPGLEVSFKYSDLTNAVAISEQLISIVLPIRETYGGTVSLIDSAYYVNKGTNFTP